MLVFLPFYGRFLPALIFFFHKKQKVTIIWISPELVSVFINGGFFIGDFCNLVTVYIYVISLVFLSVSQREKCPYSEFFWSIFSYIWTEYGQIQTRKTPNTDTFCAVFTVSHPDLEEIKETNFIGSLHGDLDLNI